MTTAAAGWLAYLWVIYREHGLRGMCICRCCRKPGVLHAWLRWGGRIPLPVCALCKHVGCDRCRD